MTAFLPKAPGPKGKEQTIKVDKALIQRAIATLPLLTGSVRSIKVALVLLFGVHQSIGYISETVQEAGPRARVYNR